MTDRALHFAEVDVNRVRGVARDEAFSLPSLSPGVNLIYGPNASGKSTTARVIQELLWPGRTGLDRPSVASQFRDNDHQWTIEIDAGHVQTLRDGVPGNAPQLGPPENRHRYHLALHELVQQENRNTDFAKQIADASQGGYDLNAAAEALDYREKPPGKRKQREALERRRDAIRLARERQAGLEHEAMKLKELREKHAATLEAERTLERLKRAQEYRCAAEEHRAIEIELEAIPAGVARLRGDERDDLDRFDVEQLQRENDQSAEQERIREAEAALSEARLPAQGIDQETLTRLRGWRHQLVECETDIRQYQTSVDEAESTAENARRRLGHRLTDVQLAAIDRIEIDDLDAFAPKVEQFRADQALLREKQQWLHAVEPEEVRDLDDHQLHEGIAALARWLSAPTSPQSSRTSPSWFLVLAIVLIMGLAIALAVTHHFAWCALALLSPALAWLDWRARRSPLQERGTNDRHVHRSTFEQTGLTPPATWDIDAVTARLRELVGLAGIRALEDDRARRRADLADIEQNLDFRERELNREKEALQEQLGVELVINDAWISQLLKKIDQWQNASSRATGANKALHELRTRHAELCHQVDVALGPFGYEPVETAESARLQVDDLDARRQKQKEATAAITEARRRLENTIRPALRQVAGQRAAIFERLHIDADQEATIDDWLEHRENYLDLKVKLSQATALRDDRQNALAGHEELLALDDVDLQQRIDKEQAIADERDELLSQVIDIERDIEKAKEGHDLTDALAAYDAALAELEEAREQTRTAVVGHTLTNWVRQVAVDQSRPDVFSRANEILGNFTRYTLKLDLDDEASPPAFRARRSSGKSSAVDELSVGERVQLLIAVRVAFIELDERTRLPLLLDETLGTSDDERAGIIIDSVIELARDGRQIFYFTAQHDEVAKWRARLEQSGVPHKLIDLAAIRSESVAQTTPLQIATIEHPQPPTPDGRDHMAYGQLLNVPGLNPGADNIGNLHLWHLVKDTDQLYRLLCSGISTWGQLRFLQEQGGAGLVEPVVIQRASSAARAIEAAFDAWRVGRGRPVDRQVLLASGFVRETFIDELSNLAATLNGDAESIIQALANRRIGHWRQDNTERLQAYFEENDYLTRDSRLDAESVRVRILAAVANDIKQGHIDESIIDRVIGSLPR